MSVRRLAEDNVQPAAFAFTAENAAWAEATIKKYPEGRQQSAVIPLLMRAQEQDGWVTKAAIEGVADMLGMAYIRVLEVATFYTQFQLKPVGTRAHIQVCGTTPCMLRGAEDLINVCKKKIHAEPFHTNADGSLSWEEVECQGACVNAPMVMIFKDSYEDLTPTQLEHIIDRFEAGRADEIRPGPQIDRVYSAPIGGLTSLTGDTTPSKKADAAKADTASKETEAEKPEQKGKPDGSTPKPVEGEIAASQQPALDDANRPSAIDQPEKPDDLKLISGVGPVLEGKLNGLGIYTYAQVAAWKKNEIDWVDGYLSFKGRIERDEWIKQADALARGGEEEYVRVFGKKPR
jgi:NADH-quinone oxidoreductase subunit E